MPTKHKVLVVESDPTNVMLLERILGRQGYDVLKAFTGEEAVARAKRLLPAVVLLNVALPGMDGHTLLHTLRENKETRSIPVIFLTDVFQDETDTLWTEDAGPVDYITKPFGRQELLARVAVMTRMGELQRQLDTAQRLAAMGRASRLFLLDMQKPLEELRGLIGSVGAETAGELEVQLTRLGRDLETFDAFSRSADEFVPVVTSLNRLVRATVEKWRTSEDKPKPAVSLELSDDRRVVELDRPLVSSAILQLLDWLATLSTPSKHIVVRTEVEQSDWLLRLGLVEADGVLTGEQAEGEDHPVAVRVFIRVAQAHGGDGFLLGDGSSVEAAFPCSSAISMDDLESLASKRRQN